MSTPAPESVAAPAAAAASPTAPRGRILVDRELEALFGTALAPATPEHPLHPDQLQPASVDVRLGARAWRVRAGFLPARGPVEERLESFATSELSLEGDGAVLERGLVYVVPLEMELDLPPGIHGRFNPRSSTGRLDLFTRVLVPGHPRFDETPPGYRGRPWLEIAPLSFPVRVRRGDRLCQLRLSDGDAALDEEELRATHRATPLVFDGDRALPEDEVQFGADGSIALRVGLAGREPVGWRAALHTDVVEFAGQGVHDPREFFEPVPARRSGDALACVLEPGRFYVFASRERLRIPPHLAAEMLPVDVGIGELRNNYAGFFDNGFGWDVDDSRGGDASPDPSSGRPPGTPAVLEVRAHDVPFAVEDGQVFFRLRYFRTAGPPARLYGQGRSGPSYRGQDLTLARPFRAL